MGLATLGGVTFRINPTAVQWNFQINTSVTETVGGRVVQVLGATLSDLTISGSYGEDHSSGDSSTDDGAGRSWRMAEAFVKQVRTMIEQQSSDSTINSRMHEPLDFKYPPKGWDFAVYIKDIADSRSGGSVGHVPGKFSYDYQLTLFIVEDRAGDVALAGSHNGVIDKKKQQAINSYIARISKGIGWHTSGFSDPSIVVDPTVLSGSPPAAPSAADFRIAEQRVDAVVTPDAVQPPVQTYHGGV